MSDDPQTAGDEPRVNLTVNLPPNAVALMPGIADNPTIVLDLTPSEAELIASTPAQREQRFRETMERLKQFSDSSLLAKNLAVSNEILEAIRAQQAKATALAPPAPPSETPPAPPAETTPYSALLAYAAEKLKKGERKAVEVLCANNGSLALADFALSMKWDYFDDGKFSSLQSRLNKKTKLGGRGWRLARHDNHACLEPTKVLRKSSSSVVD